jgi:hypothetical protein
MVLEYKITIDVYSKDHADLLEVLLPKIMRIVKEHPTGQYEIGQVLGREIPETQTKLVE